MPLKKTLKIILLSIFSLSVQVAKADDWPCTVVLCLANPKGPTAVAECVAPIKKLFRELAKGKGFPFCDMNSGSTTGANSARNQYANGENCPPQYRYYFSNGDSEQLLCPYAGVITVKINDEPYVRVWWNNSGSVTEALSENAATQVSPKFETDYKVWKKQQEEAARLNSLNQNQ
ncbi:hypothetical protein [Janthinobacterium sp. HH102]|uniref:hypothetical protein n=1 Tax=Janthinobacterium sp. HH102 TaxID=1537274 RepID=UPI0011132080|nr:hypothetical protein [Janthinobacterium sp. HH102]